VRIASSRGSARRELAEQRGREGGDPAHQQAGPRTERLAHPPEQWTADRRAAEEHDRLQREDATAHRGVGA